MSDGRNRAASDTGETHWGSAGKRQLVGRRYLSRLGGGVPGGDRNSAARTGGQRASASWSGYAIRSGLGGGVPDGERHRQNALGVSEQATVGRVTLSNPVGGWRPGSNRHRRRRQPRCRSSSSQKAAGQLVAIAEKDLSPATNGGKGAGFDQFRRRIAAGTQAFPQNIRRRKMEIPPKNNISAFF